MKTWQWLALAGVAVAVYFVWKGTAASRAPSGTRSDPFSSADAAYAAVARTPGQYFYYRAANGNVVGVA